MTTTSSQAIRVIRNDDELTVTFHGPAGTWDMANAAVPAEVARLRADGRVVEVARGTVKFLASVGVVVS